MTSPNDDDDYQLAAAVPDTLRPRLGGERRSPDLPEQDDTED